MDSVPIDQVLQAHPSLAAVVHAAADVPVSLVGGAVRDLLIGRTDGVDLDLVAEGDAIALARSVGRELGLRVMTHERFGTAELHLHDGHLMDFVSARSERYPAPGSLPEVTPATLVDDLRRRDFTINAIALRLTGAQAGALVDPCAGRADLDGRCLRVLHDDSFVDDPSRVLRLVRYAARLGFAPHPHTATLARAAAAALDPTSARVGDELTRTVHEPTAAAALDLAAALGVPWISADPDRAQRFGALDAVSGLPGAPAVPVWALRIGLAVDPRVLGDDLAIAGWARAIARSITSGPQLAQRLAGAARPSQVDSVLHATPPPVQIAAHLAGSTRVAPWWALSLDHPVQIGGADLVAAGVAPGPAIGRALDHVRADVLDGAVGDGRDEQLEVALRYIRANDGR